MGMCLGKPPRKVKLGRIDRKSSLRPKPCIELGLILEGIHVKDLGSWANHGHMRFQAISDIRKKEISPIIVPREVLKSRISD